MSGAQDGIQCGSAANLYRTSGNQVRFACKCGEDYGLTDLISGARNTWSVEVQLLAARLALAEAEETVRLLRAKLAKARVRV